MTKILTMPAMATEGTTVCYTVTHDDLIDFAREIIERTKEMDEAEKAETRSEIMKRINETSTDFYCQDRKIVIFLILILFCIISIIIFEMLD